MPPPASGMSGSFVRLTEGATCDEDGLRVLVTDEALERGASSVWVLADAPVVAPSAEDSPDTVGVVHAPDDGGGIVVPLGPEACSDDGVDLWVIATYDTEPGAPSVWLDGIAEPGSVATAAGVLTTQMFDVEVAESGHEEVLPFRPSDDAPGTVDSAVELVELLELVADADDDWTVRVGTSAELESRVTVYGAGPCLGGACPPVVARFSSRRGASEAEARFVLYRFEVAS